MTDRFPADFAPRWFRPENDFLGDPFSSHVNPVFWSFHGWIDDRIEDWYRAHERFHPGEVQRREVEGIQWFAPGRWVEVGDPGWARRPMDAGSRMSRRAATRWSWTWKP